MPQTQIKFIIATIASYNQLAHNSEHISRVIIKKCKRPSNISNIELYSRASTARKTSEVQDTKSLGVKIPQELGRKEVPQKIVTKKSLCSLTFTCGEEYDALCYTTHLWSKNKIFRDPRRKTHPYKVHVQSLFSIPPLCKELQEDCQCFFNSEVIETIFASSCLVAFTQDSFDRRANNYLSRNLSN